MQGGFRRKHERRLIVTCPEDSLYTTRMSGWATVLGTVPVLSILRSFLHYVRSVRMSDPSANLVRCVRTILQGPGGPPEAASLQIFARQRGRRQGTLDRGRPTHRALIAVVAILQ